MTDRELMQQALYALQESKPIDINDPTAFYRSAHAIEALRARLAQPERKLWLWKNFVDGRPEYWAFDNPYPTNLDNGDPQTLGQPCGYAIFKPSRDGSCGRTEEQVLREMESVSARSERDEAPAKAVEWQGLTDEEILEEYRQSYGDDGNLTDVYFAHAIEAKLKEKNT